MSEEWKRSFSFFSLPVLCRNAVIALNSFLVWWQWVRCFSGVFGKARFCTRTSAVVLRLGTCPLASVRGTEPRLLSELFVWQQRGVRSCFLCDAEGFVLLLNHLPVLCCCTILKVFMCDGSRTALKRTSRNNFDAFFMRWSIEEPDIV